MRISHMFMILNVLLIVSHRSETEQMLYFINGLQRYTQSRVQEFCPSTLEECMQIASAIECNQFRYNKSPTKVAPIRHSSPKRFIFFQ
jgi:hypothetical protein